MQKIYGLSAEVLRLPADTLEVYLQEVSRHYINIIYYVTSCISVIIIIWQQFTILYCIILLSLNITDDCLVSVKLFLISNHHKLLLQYKTAIILQFLITQFAIILIFRIAKIASRPPLMLKILRGLRPLAPARGAAPGPRWGLRPQTPASLVLTASPHVKISLRSLKYLICTKTQIARTKLFYQAMYMTCIWQKARLKLKSKVKFS